MTSLFSAFRKSGENQVLVNNLLAGENQAGPDEHSRYQVDALNKTQSVMEIGLDGTVLSANANMLQALDYRLEDLAGKPLTMLLDPKYADSSEYRMLWRLLKSGKHDTGEFKLLGKTGGKVWIKGAYHAIVDDRSKPLKVLLFGVDITDQKHFDADTKGQITAINKSQSIIEFNMEGYILYANDNCLNTLDYSLRDVMGKHHSMLLEEGHANSDDFKRLWQKLKKGEFDSGMYRRVGRNGKQVWIRASYNPILDLNGEPCKVVEYASDVTDVRMRNADYQGQIAAISKSQAVTEYRLDGTIITANDNALKLTGYNLSEVKGKSHAMFVAEEFAGSVEYKEFWARLARGEFNAGEYRCVCKGGRESWIQASYNPIMDMDGKPAKVVEYATDITAQRTLHTEIQDMVRETQNVMQAVSEGNLDIKMGAYDGEFRKLGESINACIDKLTRIVHRINHGASGIRAQAQKTAEDSRALSQQTQQQAAGIEETVAIMDEMSASTRENAENVKGANNLAGEVRQQAEKGGDVIAQVIDAMNGIQESSSRIAAIIGVIDEIAFQTNLLALNAAVEAARAGDHGKGFAVVAAEVGNLAKRSANSAKEIKGLIQESVEKVGNGSRLVNESSDSLREIVTSVAKVSEVIARIADASGEQAQGISQVNSAIMEMDKSIQNNAAMVEGTASAAESMNGHANELIEVMAFFRQSAR